MCTSFIRNETGVYNREEIFVYYAHLSDSSKDKSYFVLLEEHVRVSLFLKVPVYRSYLQNLCYLTFTLLIMDTVTLMNMLIT
jgi:hypothetical protein